MQYIYNYTIHKLHQTDIDNGQKTRLYSKLPYSFHIMPTPPFLSIRFSYKYGGGLIMVISLIYTTPFLAMERKRETAMEELSVRLARKLVVTQFCREKDH